jgi:hypothetical protein
MDREELDVIYDFYQKQREALKNIEKQKLGLAQKERELKLLIEILKEKLGIIS